MRILIVSWCFPPFNSIGSVRVGKMAKYLSKFGHDVKIITAKTVPYETTLPLEIPLENILATDCIHYTHWLSPRKIAKQWFNNRVNAAKPTLMENRKRNKDGEREDLGILFSITNFLNTVYRNVLYFPDGLLGWIPFALSATSSLINKGKPDVIYATAPPFTSLIVASLLSRKYKIPWVAELRDLWVDNHYYSFLYPRWRKRPEQLLERLILSSATGFVTVSEPLAETLRKKYGKSVAVILNGFDPEDYPASFKLAVNEINLRIVYTGNLYQGRQHPSALFEAFKKLGSLADKVKVEFYGTHPELVLEEAVRYGVEPFVIINERVPYQESLKLQLNADVLLLILWNDSEEKGVYTGKLFEYIGSGRPILAIGHPDNVAADLIRERNAGVVLNDPEEIAEQLKKWIHQKETLGEIPGLPSDVGVGLSREEQARNLEKFLEQEITQKK